MKLEIDPISLEIRELKEFCKYRGIVINTSSILFPNLIEKEIRYMIHYVLSFKHPYSENRISFRSHQEASLKWGYQGDEKNLEERHLPQVWPVSNPQESFIKVLRLTEEFLNGRNINVSILSNMPEWLINIQQKLRLC